MDYSKLTKIASYENGCLEWYSNKDYFNAVICCYCKERRGGITMSCTYVRNDLIEHIENYMSSSETSTDFEKRLMEGEKFEVFLLGFNLENNDEYYDLIEAFCKEHDISITGSYNPDGSRKVEEEQQPQPLDEADRKQLEELKNRLGTKAIKEWIESNEEENSKQ